MQLTFTKSPNVIVEVGGNGKDSIPVNLAMITKGTPTTSAANPVNPKKSIMSNSASDLIRNFWMIKTSAYRKAESRQTASPNSGRGAWSITGTGVTGGAVTGITACLESDTEVNMHPRNLRIFVIRYPFP